MIYHLMHGGGTFERCVCVDISTAVCVHASDVWSVPTPTLHLTTGVTHRGGDGVGE